MTWIWKAVIPLAVSSENGERLKRNLCSRLESVKLDTIRQAPKNLLERMSYYTMQSLLKREMRFYFQIDRENSVFQEFTSI
jgi:hypothetical protein